MPDLPPPQPASRRTLSFLSLVALGSLTLAVPASAADDGWTSLFNGKDLSGWIPPKGDHAWKVIDGVIDYEAKGGNLVTEKQFEDYVLRLEWRFKRTAGPPYAAFLYNPDGSKKLGPDGKPLTQPIPNADSGIFVRGVPQTQVNLWCWPCGSGQLWSYQDHKDPAIRKGALPIVKADRPVGEWNEMELTVRGDALHVVLNGKTVIDTRMPGAPLKGPIALQHHGGFNTKKNEWNAASALIQFRNIRIKELPRTTTSATSATSDAPATPPPSDGWQDLWNGKDFTGFAFHLGKEGAPNKDTYRIEDGTIVCSGKPSGYMHTVKPYSRYTLSYDWAFKRPDDLADDTKFRGNNGCLIHIGDANALGVWPRSIEVQGMNVQAGLILPIPRNLKCKVTDDKEARKQALKPVGEWNTTTIDVDGGNMTIHVNGKQVSTVADCELTSGPIGFQSEGAEIRFRNLRIREKR